MAIKQLAAMVNLKKERKLSHFLIFILIPPLLEPKLRLFLTFFCAMIIFNFVKKADEEIEYLFETLEEQGIDTDLNEEILYIFLNKSTVYVVNKHIVSEQIWLSSPISGAHKFSYVDCKWSGLRDLLRLELGVDL